MNCKLNCWEFMKCGRQPGGRNETKNGACPATMEHRAHGINQGVNGGRACWAISRTYCSGNEQGGHLQKLSQCMQCDFYALVRSEEGPVYMSSREILKNIKIQDGQKDKTQ